MGKTVKTIVIRTAGTNCEKETAFAFEQLGAKVDLVHIKQLIAGKVSLADYQILTIPGGFSYGDDIESGKILANELCAYLTEHVKKFISDKKLILGICNGFQVLVKAGILPGSEEKTFKQTTTLTFNDSGKFEDRWVHLKVGGNSVWTKGLEGQVYYPVAHMEGKFVTDKKTLKSLKDNGQIAFQYCSPNGCDPEYPQNPNGALENIAGITDKSGRILGLMPHPERHYLTHQHPFWTRLKKTCPWGEGAKLFQNAVEYCKKSN